MVIAKKYSETSSMLINRLPIRPRKSTLLLRPPVGIGSRKEKEWL